MGLPIRQGCCKPVFAGQKNESTGCAAVASSSATEAFGKLSTKSVDKIVDHRLVPGLKQRCVWAWHFLRKFWPEIILDHSDGYTKTKTLNGAPPARETGPTRGCCSISFLPHPFPTTFRPCSFQLTSSASPNSIAGRAQPWNESSPCFGWPVKFPT